MQEQSFLDSVLSELMRSLPVGKGGRGWTTKKKTKQRKPTIIMKVGGVQG